MARGKAFEISRASLSDKATTPQQLQGNTCRQLPSSLYHQFAMMGNNLCLFRFVNQFYLVFSWYDQLYSITNVQIVCSLVNNGAVLLFDVVSLMVGPTTGVLMSPGHGGYQETATKDYYTSPPYYATKSTYATSIYYAEAPKCYTTKAQELRDKLCSPELHHQSAWVLHHRVYCPSLLHDYECCPSLLHRGCSYFNTKAVECYTEPLKYSLPRST
jgi:hypothetical protein